MGGTVAFPVLSHRAFSEVDNSLWRAEPPQQVMGDMARTSFYMEDTYGIRLSDPQRQLLTAWNTMDPPDEWEKERNHRIAKMQGRGNRFVEE